MRMVGRINTCECVEGGDEGGQKESWSRRHARTVGGRRRHMLGSPRPRPALLGRTSPCPLVELPRWAASCASMMGWSESSCCEPMQARSASTVDHLSALICVCVGGEGVENRG